MDEYRRLGDCGVLTPEDRVELLEGWIAPKQIRRPAHRFAVGLLNEWLQKHLPAGFFGLCQLPISTARSEPEPDLSVIHGAHADFRDRHPQGQECRLLIEVADNAVERDRQKAAIYADADIEEYWILNLVDRQLEKFAQSSPDGYESQIILSFDESVKLTLDECTLKLELGMFA